MFDNVGKKIKKLIKLLFAITSILIAIITIFVTYLMVEMFGGGMAFVVLLIGGLFIVLAWIGTWLLYGYAELVDRTISIEKHLNPYKSPNPTPTPTPDSNPGHNDEERYTKLVSLLAQGLITQKEFDDAISNH